MDRIRMFYSNVDTKPRVLINHFVRYLGFFVEEITGDTMESDVESLLDIYIISDAFIEENSIRLDIKNEEKTILIWLDGWRTELAQDMFAIRYDESMEDADFLEEFCYYMTKILSTRIDFSRRLIGSVDDVEEVLDDFIGIYIDNNILQMSLFARCYYASDELFAVAFQAYKDFILGLGEIENKYLFGDLVRYMELLACYELDMICKRNSYSMKYKPDILHEESKALLRKYVENEELHILQADINLYLRRIWNKAGNEYADIRLRDCAYMYLKQGDILRKHVNDLETAISAYEEAVKRKADYYIAYYRMGKCYKKLRQYENAMQSYQQVYVILERRYQLHVLSPLEITYLFKAANKLVEISEIDLYSSRLAKQFAELAEKVKNEIIIGNYFKEVWNDVGAFSRYFPLVKNELRNRLKKPVGINIKKSGRIEI